MKEKYFNDAIIGNKSMVASFPKQVNYYVFIIHKLILSNTLII